MIVSNGAAMLELDIQGFVLNPVLVWDEQMAVLIDTGMPGQLRQIQDAMGEAGVPFEKLKAIILTHQDLDHIGSLPELANHFPNQIEVYSHKLDQPYIEGDLRLLKTDPERMSKEEWESLPEMMKHLYKNPPKSKVHKTLEDRQVLPFCGGIEVIFTPGHTPGHISLYLKQSKTLIAGDAMVAANGKLMGPVPRATPDMKTAAESLKRFLDYDIEKVICYHGGIVSINGKAELEAAIQETISI